MYYAYTFTFLECIKRENYVTIHFEKNIAIKEIFVRTVVMAQYEKNTYPFQKT